jgi:hypothetical protein
MYNLYKKTTYWSGLKVQSSKFKVYGSDSPFGGGWGEVLDLRLTITFGELASARLTIFDFRV